MVRADPVICGHSGEARNLAEVALTRGFDDVRLLTWPIPTLQAAGLPLKPLDRLLPYSAGHHRRAARAGRRLPGAGRAPPGRPHRPPGRAARRAGADDLPVDVPRAAHHRRHRRRRRGAGGRLRAGRAHHGQGGRLRRHQRDPVVPAARAGSARPTVLFTTFLANDEVVAVSEYTRERDRRRRPRQVDAHCGTTLRRAVPAPGDRQLPADRHGGLPRPRPGAVDAALARRGLERDGYILFLSRVARAKGIYDLVIAFGQMRCRSRREARRRRHRAGAGARAGDGQGGRPDRLPHRRRRRREAAAHARLRGVRRCPPSPSRTSSRRSASPWPRRCWPAADRSITTTTGGTGEAVGDTAVIVEPGDIAGLAAADRPGGAGHARRRSGSDLEVRARAHAHVLRPRAACSTASCRDVRR